MAVAAAAAAAVGGAAFVAPAARSAQMSQLPAGAGVQAPQGQAHGSSAGVGMAVLGAATAAAAVFRKP
eukprot:993479-Heterocapsa_arctica.AAC.1